MHTFLLGTGVAALLLATMAPAQGGGPPADRTARMLERFDANKDGKLSKDEVTDERMWTRLVAADKDGDGIVSKEEMAAMPANTPARGGRGQGGGRDGGGEQAFKFLAEKYDADKNGEVSKQEYARDAATFTRLDRNQDGVLTAADWQVESSTPRRGGGDRNRSTGPQAGTAAPDFELTLVSDAEKKVKLSSFRGNKPVALIFGSCT